MYGFFFSIWPRLLRSPHRRTFAHAPAAVQHGNLCTAGLNWPVEQALEQAPAVRAPPTNAVELET